MTGPIHLPHFSDPNDVDEFVAVLEQYERGEISPEKFRAFRLTRGVYGQRQEGVQMIRVKIPLGVLAPEQLDALADVAERYTPEAKGHITTRQNFQFHFVKMSSVEAALRRLDEVGLTTREACGNTVRNVTADPLSGVCATGLFDVRPYGEAVIRHLLRADYDQALPRKFKIALSCCPHDCAMASINDLGLVAAERDGNRGFRVMCAGGLSTTPQQALVLHDFVPVEEILDVAEALVRLFDRSGNRENKARARLKYVLRKLGEVAFRREYAIERDKIRASGGTPLTDLPAIDDPPPPPRGDDLGATVEPISRGPGYVAWRASNVVPQVQAGYFAVYVQLPLGDLTALQMRALARIAPRFGDGSLRTSLDQNLLMRFVPTRQLPGLFSALTAEGLARPGAATVEDVTTCPGADSCALAVTASRQLGKLLGDHLSALEGEARVALGLARSATIKISGCPNSCGQHHIADLGFHGAVRRFGERSAPVYQLHLGGSVHGTTGATFGRQVIKIPAKRIPTAVERLLLLFARERNTDESPRAFYHRVAEDRVTALLEDLSMIDLDAPDAEFMDIGQEQNFKVAIGTGECAA